MHHEQPNLLFILPDHQAWYGHSRPGEFELDLPTWQQFVAEGVAFDRAYCVCPLSSPARTSMMTGVYPTRHRMITNCDRGGEIPPGLPLYSHYLSRAGYRNAYVGKWHCGHQRLPIDYGIEGWSLPDYGKPYESPAYLAYAAQRGLGAAEARIDCNLDHPEWAGRTMTLEHPSAFHFMNGSGVLEGPPEAHEEHFVTHLAIEKLRELALGDQPFSLVASYWGPHHPYFPTEPFASIVDPSSIPEYPSFRDNLRGRPSRYLLHRECHHPGAKAITDWADWQTILARCYGQALQTDDAIGRLLSELDRLGLADNTLVIWCADHGDAVASHGGLWDKGATMIEEVMRVPLAVRWPVALTGGQRRDQLISNLDVTATLLDAAGVAVPESMDSRSLLPLCRDGAADWPDEVISQHHGHGGTMVLQRMIVVGSYKYVAALYDGDELYDLQTDPYEMSNRIDDPALAGVLVELRRRLREQMKAVDDQAYDAMRLGVVLDAALAGG